MSKVDHGWIIEATWNMDIMDAMENGVGFAAREPESKLSSQNVCHCESLFRVIRVLVQFISIWRGEWQETWPPGPDQCNQANIELARVIPCRTHPTNIHIYGIRILYHSLHGVASESHIGHAWL